ncbi:hypothetical protein GUITHDRAFT_99116 [Guillardia theta CCMP2712]|uniref:Uncharacterized protein n=1 Tax=Guillardia theta (strain CCMP2712) TaxID=905079 RepID=L1K4G1_GUITC|nr:hypothetical protein GUITHDRAFT_99116 [Guillardia theta CCMP2712]EKX55335.1 hypothetical protein GUITHDRAFT_99116 [Guillardia theta CCMP2712]|eukprot:XP_005842315.1 hypothetical protein GUITHDRAFT_99116 [Guillardia theta CCMP2712]
MKKYMLADLKLEIQPRESKVYIPSWHQHPDLSQLKKSLKRRLKTQLLHFEVVTGGITLGGLPIGTDGFHASQLRAKVSTLNEELSKLGLVQHGFMFKTLVRASHLQKLRFFLQGSSPFLPRVQSQIRRFDLSVHLALEKYHRWPSSQYLAAHPDLLEFARFKRELPHSRGGDEFTPSEGLHPAVYWGIGFTGRRHTVHSEKLHKHTQNTSPKRTSTAGTQTRQRQPKREAAQTSSLRVKQSV